MTRLLLVLPLVLLVLLPLLLADASNYLTTKQGAPKIMQNEEEFKGFKEAQEGTIDKNILIYSKDDVDCLLM